MNNVAPTAYSGFQTNLRIFSTGNPSSRRRFQDFVFLRENLVRDFPACVVPPLPDKHRLGIFYGILWCFSISFFPQNTSLGTGSARSSWNVDVSSKLSLHVCRTILKYTSLDRFLQRLSRHPTLQRSTLVRAFFESTEWVSSTNTLRSTL